MENKEALEFFRVTAGSADDALSCKLSLANDHTQMDADFILRHADRSTEILDLGSGTGLIIGKIYDKVASICAVEPFPEFTKYIVSSDNIEIHNATLLDFATDRKFDLITLFGVMHYFNGEEAAEVYRKYLPFLKKGGKLIVKNQFGVNEDVVVSGYSEEQQRNYFASYRHIEAEQRLLAGIGYGRMEVFDIYPPECNRWDNTHFYAITAEGPGAG